MSDVHLTPEQASDHATYMGAMKRAAEQGGVVVVGQAPEIARLEERVRQLEAELADARRKP